MPHITFRSAAFGAMGAALLFGASTPLAKQLLHDTSPVMLAGLLYLGSGVGLGMTRTIRDRAWRAPVMTRGEWSWYMLAILFGGVLGPLLLMLGLTRTSAATASLLLNLETVLTALLAWTVFHENTDRRIVLGMLLIVAGAALLALPGSSQGAHLIWGALLIAGACLCWALDNNFTRKVSASDAIHCRTERPHCWHRQCRHRADTWRSSTFDSCDHRSHDRRVAWLRHQSCAVRARLARAGVGAHRCILLDCTVHRCCDCNPGLRRTRLMDVLAGRRPDGRGRMATSHRAP